MSGVDIQYLDSFLRFLKNNLGFHKQLDEKISTIHEHRNFFKERIKDRPSLYGMDKSVFEKLVNLIEKFHSYRQNPEHMKARAFLQNVTSDLVSSIPSSPDPLVLFSDTNNLLDFNLGNRNDYFVEISFLEEKTIAGCSGLNHEVGHCLFKEYMLQNGNPQDFLQRINPPLIKLLKKLNSSNILDSAGLWIFNWLAEFTGDAFSVDTLGIGGLVRFIKELEYHGIPLFIGSDTHPPLNLRIQFMKDRLMKFVREQDIESSSLHVIKGWSASGRNQMPTEAYVKGALNDPQFNREAIQRFVNHHRITSIPNKLAFDRKILRTMYSYIDRILEWGGVNQDYSSILRAKEELQNNAIPDEPSHNTFAALIDITEGNQNLFLEELLRSNIVEI
jgi:hypothetical protein